MLYGGQSYSFPSVLTLLPFLLHSNSLRRALILFLKSPKKKKKGGKAQSNLNRRGRFLKVLQTVTKTAQSSSHIPNTFSSTQFTTWVCFCHFTPCQVRHFSHLAQQSSRQVPSGSGKTWTPKGRQGSRSSPTPFTSSPSFFTEPGRQQAVKKKKKKERNKGRKQTSWRRGFPHFSLSQPQSPPTQSRQASFHSRN